MTDLEDTSTVSISWSRIALPVNSFPCTTPSSNSRAAQERSRFAPRGFALAIQNPPLIGFWQQIGFPLAGSTADSSCTKGGPPGWHPVVDSVTTQTEPLNAVSTPQYSTCAGVSQPAAVSALAHNLRWKTCKHSCAACAHRFEKAALAALGACTLLVLVDGASKGHLQQAANNPSWHTAQPRSTPPHLCCKVCVWCSFKHKAEWVSCEQHHTAMENKHKLLCAGATALQAKPQLPSCMKLTQKHNVKVYPDH